MQPLDRASLTGRLWKWLMRHSWLLLAVFGGCLFVVAFVGLEESFKEEGKSVPKTVTFYLTTQIFTLDYGLLPGPVNGWLEIAFVLAPIFLFCTAGKVLVSIFYGKAQELWIRAAYSGHAVICGLDRKAARVALDLQNQGVKVVIVDKSEANPFADGLLDRGAVYLKGDPVELRALREAGMKDAGFAVCAREDDGLNCEAAAAVTAIVRETRHEKRLSVLVHIESSDLCALLRSREAELEENACLDLQLFNVFDRGAKLLLNEYPAFGDAFDRAPHALLIGLGRLGGSVLVECFRQSEALQPVGEDVLRHLTVTVLSEDPRPTVDALAQRKLLRRAAVRSFPVDLKSPRFAEQASSLLAQGQPTIVYVLIGDEALGMKIGLTMRTVLKNLKQPHDPLVPIVLRTAVEGGLGSFLPREGKETTEFSSVKAFPVIDRACRADWPGAVTKEMLARAFHADYVWSMARHGHTRATKPLMVSWRFLTDGQQAANEARADFALNLLPQAGFELQTLSGAENERLFLFSDSEIEMLAQTEHKRWSVEKTNARWKHGPVRDDKHKRHPDLVDWKDLSESSKAYNRDSIRRLPFLLAALDLTIRPRRTQ